MLHNNLILPTSLIATAALCWTAQSLFSLLGGKKLSPLLSSACFAVPSICLLGAACTGWNANYFFEPPYSILSFGANSWHLKIDTLASVYLGLLGFSGLAVAIFSPGYLTHLEDRLHFGQYWAELCIFMLSMMMVIVSANAVVFLVFWELMSLSSLALVASEHVQHRVQKAALIYLGATRVATAFLSVGFVWMYSHFHSWDFSSWNFSHNQELCIPGLLILLGFCIKAGIWPFHGWLPYAHPAAPSPVSALMSGVMIKIAIYAIIRILVANGAYSPFIAYTAFGLGIVSAFWGVLFALVQWDLKRLLAFSSVENVGLMLLAIGVALLAHPSGHPLIADMALAAAIFHSINHGLFKSLLFLGAGAVDSVAHTLELKDLGGLASKMPWTSACFLLGSASICSLPPLNGFASKWLLYQSLFQTTWQHALAPLDRSIALASLGALAMIGGLALACFCKAFGIVFLGKARSAAAAHVVQEVSAGMIFAQLMLALACVIIGLAAGPIVGILMSLSANILHNGVLPSTELTFPVPILTFTLGVLGIYAVVHLFFLKPERLKRYISWECGFGENSPRSQATGVSIAQPIARIFDPILKSKLTVEIAGSDKRHFPEKIMVEPRLGMPLEDLIYIPVITLVQSVAKTFNKMQAGSIHLYLLYVCMTLVILLMIGIQL